MNIDRENRGAEIRRAVAWGVAGALALGSLALDTAPAEASPPVSTTAESTTVVYPSKDKDAPSIEITSYRTVVLSPSGIEVEVPASFIRYEPAANKIALTFDDGPNPYWTAEILDILKEKDVRVTFFVLSEQVDEYPELVKRMAREGHSVQIHGGPHYHYTKYSAERVDEYIDEGAQSIIDATGVSPNCFRPPFGDYNRKVVEVVFDNGQKLIMWDPSGDSKDYAIRSASGVLRKAENTREGDIFIGHPEIWGSVYTKIMPSGQPMLAEMIDEFREKGYGFDLLCAEQEIPLDEISHDLSIFNKL